MADAPPTVVHDAANHRFELIVGGLRCELDYRQAGTVLHLYRTFVPPALEGRGLASVLVSAAVSHALQAGVQIAPDCSYVRTWLKRHPEHQGLLAPGSGTLS